MRCFIALMDVASTLKEVLLELLITAQEHTMQLLLQLLLPLHAFFLNECTVRKSFEVVVSALHE